MKKKNALQIAIEIAGSQTELSKRSGIKQQNISYWLTQRDGVVPAEYVHDLCSASDGNLKPSDFRPDIFITAA